MPQNTALRAGVLMVSAMGSFVCNDTIMKIVGKHLPVGELISLRGIMSVVILTAVCAVQGVLTELPKIRHASVLLRSTADLFATTSFVMALVHMPIANLTSVLQAVPLVVALLSMVFLGEEVGWRRMIAIIGGFIGVLMIVKPSVSTADPYEFLALAIVVFVAMRDLMTKRIPARIPVFVVALANACFVTLGGLMLMLWQGAEWPELWQVGLLALAACFLSSGYLLMVATLRLGELTGTAPFRYSVMVFAIISGIVVFGEFPDRIAILGMILIVICGLYAARREAIRARDKALTCSARTQAP